MDTLEGSTILVVDDDHDIVNAISRLLEMEGFKTVKAYDGFEALDCLMQNEIQLILIDIMMPKLDGVSVLEEMRKAQIFIPVILLTAKAEVEDRIAGLRAGADDYLAKPFSMGELVARIDALTRRNNT